ncbi:MAG: ATP-binding cassette domain-containing protein [Bacteroidetes bacterium]|nr:ATP-binding cassette domain-containing protein [Bacteroidota bacterium]MBU1117132.1 ATP-binding cassette domain-containing protein [Bacteroidota bacterium]MBU1800325.1 ATP-binding cassette domain-containing protein [Bacteroidota bacterium]
MIELENVSYSLRDINILSKISLNINKGDIFGLIGESGAGKTTIAKIIAGVLQPTSGLIKLSNIKLSDIQLLFQNNFELVNPHRKVRSILNDVLSFKNKKLDINEFLQMVGLNNSILSKHAYQLSGGERQRIALVKLLIVSPKVLILDEPFSAQDTDSQIELVNLFKYLNSELNITIFCVSHDLNIMSHFPNKLSVIKNGIIVEQGETEDIVANAKADYTKFLFTAAKYKLSIKDFN